MSTEKYTVCNREKNKSNKDVGGFVLLRKCCQKNTGGGGGGGRPRETQTYLRERERGRFMGDLRPSSSMEGLLSPDEKCREWE